MQEDKPKKGVGLTVFGSVLFFLAMLNIAFYTKAEIELPKFYIYLLIAGLVVFIIGTSLNRKKMR